MTVLFKRITPGIGSNHRPSLEREREVDWCQCRHFSIEQQLWDMCIVETCLEKQWSVYKREGAVFTTYGLTKSPLKWPSFWQIGWLQKKRAYHEKYASLQTVSRKWTQQSLWESPKEVMQGQWDWSRLTNERPDWEKMGREGCVKIIALK